jgi:hypothetical protein
VEPLHPAERDALKRAHPGLVDRDIDRSEELLARIRSLDPEQDRAELERLEAELNVLLRERMPRYRVVLARIATDLIDRQRPAPRVVTKGHD